MKVRSWDRVRSEWLLKRKPLVWNQMSLCRLWQWKWSDRSSTLPHSKPSSANSKWWPTLARIWMFSIYSAPAPKIFQKVIQRIMCYSILYNILTCNFVCRWFACANRILSLRQLSELFDQTPEIVCESSRLEWQFVADQWNIWQSIRSRRRPKCHGKSTPVLIFSSSFNFAKAKF